MKKGFYKIEKNVPMKKWTRGSKKVDPEIEALKKLEPGQSMVIPYTVEQKASYRVKLNGLRKTVDELAEKELTVNDLPEDEGYLRVWAKG